MENTENGAAVLSPIRVRWEMVRYHSSHCR